MENRRERGLPETRNSEVKAEIKNGRDQDKRGHYRGCPVYHPLSWGSLISSPRYDFLLQEPSLSSTVTIGGRTYKGYDNGKANTLVPVDTLSPAQRAARQRDHERLALMTNHPLAGASYGLASLLGASSPTRDRALAAGVAANTAVLGGQGRAPSAARLPAPRARVAPPTLERPSFRLGRLNEDGQASGATATLTAPLLGTGTRSDRRLTPPGWQGHGTRFNEARGHLIARMLGGTGRDMRNLVTLTQHGANTPQMQRFEEPVARRVRAGEVIEYTSTPLYRPGVLPPSAVLLTAQGARAEPVARLILNPAGRRR